MLGGILIYLHIMNYIAHTNIYLYLYIHTPSRSSRSSEFQIGQPEVNLQIDNPFLMSQVLAGGARGNDIAFVLVSLVSACIARLHTFLLCL